MQIKKFVADNMTQVMALVKKEMGNEAIILQTKKAKTKGVLGFFKKDVIEVLAAIEPDKTVNRAQLNKTYDYKANNKILVEKKDESKNYISSNDRNIAKNDVSFKEVNKVYQKPTQTLQSEKDITKDIDEIKSVIKDLNNRFSQTFKTEEDEETSKLKVNYSNKLESKGMSKSLSEELIQEALETYNSCDQDIIIKVINSKFSNFERKNKLSTIKKYNVFVGPTGVGKTTTLAKIASNIAINESKRIGFMTLDTYRISAVEQLRTYAEILNCPIEVAYDKEDVTEAIKRLESRDVVFIDTAGRSHKNKGHMKELEEILNSIIEKEVFLVISANFNKDDIKDILCVYSFISEYNIIITKMDETSREGLVFDIMNESKQPIAYTTYGQNVPDDIEMFDLTKFINEFSREI